MSIHNVLIVTGDGQSVSGGLGRADVVALAGVEDGVVDSWDLHPVGWGASHDGANHVGHHEVILGFLQGHQVGALVSGHVGPSMKALLDRAGIMVFEYEGMPARNAAMMAGSVLARRLSGGTPPTRR